MNRLTSPGLAAFAPFGLDTFVGTCPLPGPPIWYVATHEFV